MLKHYMEKRHEEEGFTLIELMVVVLIIGILIAIALPTFLGARNRANDKAAQSGLRNALAAAKTCFTDADTYNTGANVCNAATLQNIETSLNFVVAGTDSTSPDIVSVNAFDDTRWYGAAYSKSQTCFMIKDDASATAAPLGGTTFRKVGVPSTGAGCNATAARAADGAFSKTGWQ